MKVPLLIFALLVTCGLEPRPRIESHFESDSFVRAPDARSTQEGVISVQAEIRQMLESRKLANLTEEIAWENLKTTDEFYSSDHYLPAWWDTKGPTRQATMLIDLLRNSENEGLSADDYDTRGLQERLQEIQSQDQLTADRIAAFDVMLTLSALRYMSDLHRGRVDPRRAKWNVEPHPADFDQVRFLRQRLISAPNVSATIEELEPPFPGYRRTKAALQRYLTLAKEGEGPAIPVPNRDVHPGETYAGVQALRERLRRTRDFPADASISSDEVYAGTVVEAVRSFQERHGLAANGILDAATVKEISVPFAQRTAQLALSLERWRWLPADTRPPMIVINIPAFQLRAYEDHSLALTMPVVVGKAFKGRQTPVFTDELEYIIFRPYWYVPVEITRKELAVRAALDPEYLQKNGFSIVDKTDHVVETDGLSSAVLEQLRSGKLQLRQEPGASNSLGLIKFLFPNNYSVYLHGTPETRLFEHTRRDFSHGCIRVQDPVGLALWVLRDDPSWTRERIDRAIRAENSERVNLQRPIPVLVLYATAMVEENGEVRFYDDIYGLDNILKRLLAERSDKVHFTSDAHGQRQHAQKLRAGNTRLRRDALPGRRLAVSRH